MPKEKKKENGCKIFCIYFQNDEKKYDFGKWKGKAQDILKTIANLGETKDYYNSRNLDSLYTSFDKISDAIQNNFTLFTYK